MYLIGRTDNDVIYCVICKKAYTKPRWFQYHVESRHMPLIDEHLQVARLIRQDDNIFLLSNTEFQEMVNINGLVKAANEMYC